ncbi:Nif3-like dinuclear metal center hexameric protein [Shewanella sedimentimangrovi]|uniref:Nif3-like dinuclear metal center hexameric protein n=1 Tax=Shewanella sedimentimangrovi TaxID=2814293 RepID=A0ABX7QW71_9GAMM|nr:Nif3-like dinuclear metal center hexameric protein [Shewanella sedimentimangrovi]QSX35746.1 Nif3-like dinuclear metal center hexameric protein [Shewanella sedimentimangrovi]
MKRTELDAYLADFLQINRFKDYAPNGLQVEGKEEVRTLVTGVTACQALIDKAIALNADALLVHHGFFWKNEPEVITGMKQRRIKALLQHDISLFGYHLPLDAHPVVGNNATLADKLGLIEAEAHESMGDGLLWWGHTELSQTAAEFTATLERALGRTPLHIGDPQGTIHSVAWCTGGAQDYIDMAVQLGVDAFISGEVSERTFHCAQEQGIHYFAAGHHATERFGIEALGQHLARKFGLEHHFVDISNPV